MLIQFLLISPSKDIEIGSYIKLQKSVNFSKAYCSYKKGIDPRPIYEIQEGVKVI